MEPSCHSAEKAYAEFQIEMAWKGGGGEEEDEKREEKEDENGGRESEGRRGRPVGRVASPGTEKSGSGQTVLRVVGRIVSDPDSRELSQTAFSSETTVGPVYPTVSLFSRSDDSAVPMAEMRSVCHS